MSGSVTASAPGKVVLGGEYAVLFGAPAIAMAVNRRARVTTRNATASRADPASLVGTIRNALGSEQAVDCNTDAFYAAESEAKLGLGSSAALTVALLAALRNSDDVLADAMQLHRRWQGGAGSGVDVACSAHGGLIEYRADAQSIAALTWPEHLNFRLIWSGTPSDTRDKLARLCDRDASAAVELTSCAEDLASVWRAGNAEDVLRAVARYTDALQTFDTSQRLGIFDAGHAELRVAAKHADLVYKPCGAGGGDVGILLGSDSERLDAFVDAQRLNVVHCELDACGVQLG